MMHSPPTMTITSPISAYPYKIAPGYFVLQDVKADTNVPPADDEERRSQYEDGRSLTKKAFYILSKSCVSTPYGYFVPSNQKDGVEAEFDEVSRMVAALNEVGGFNFRATVLYLPVDTHDPRVARALAEYTIDRLYDLEHRLADPVRTKTALIYTQDTVKRLHLFSTGVYAAKVRTAVDHAINEAKRRRKNPNHSLDLRPIEDAIKIFQEAIGNVIQ